MELGLLILFPGKDKRKRESLLFVPTLALTRPGSPGQRWHSGPRLSKHQVAAYKTPLLSEPIIGEVSFFGILYTILIPIFGHICPIFYF